MAPSELAWQAEDDDGCRSTAPWPASGAAGLELRRRPQAPGWSGALHELHPIQSPDWSWAYLRELRPGAAPRPVARVVFAPGGGRVVREQLPSGRWQWHELPDRCASVRLRWERAAGRWKLWAEAGGERLVLEATFETCEPQLELCTSSEWVDRFDFSLLPPPGPVRTLQSPPPSCAQLQARIDQLTAELETEKQQKAEFVQNLQKQLDELARQKAEEMKKVEDLQKANETLQQRIAFLTQKAQKSEMTQCIVQLKEQCDAFLAFSRSDSDPQADEGPGLLASKD